MCRRPLPLAMVALLLAGSGASPGAGYSVRSWDVGDGLPNNSVQALCQTQDGLLWIATRFGLARFDGLRFETYPRPSDGTNVDDNQIALAEARDGGLWVGAFDGLLRFRSGSFERVAGVGQRRIWAILPDGEALWLGLDDGLGRWEQGRLTVSPVPGDPRAGRIRSLHRLADGSVLVTTVAGWRRLEPSTGILADWLPTAGPDAAPPQLASPDRPGGWREIDRRRLTPAVVEELFDPQGRDQLWGARWITSRSGTTRWLTDSRRRLYRLDGSQLVRVAGSVHPEEQVLCGLVDREGNLWLGTAWNGLKRLRADVLQTIVPLRMESDPHISNLAVDALNTVWAVHRDYLFRLDTGRVEARSLRELGVQRRLQNLRPDDRGGVWLVEAPARLLHLGPDGVVDHTASLGPTRGRIHTLLAESDGTLWLGRADGVSRWRGGEVRDYGAADGSVPVNVRALHRDRAGRLWAATLNGLALLEGERWRGFTTADGLAGNVCWGFCEDSRGGLWILGREGLTRFMHGHFAAVTAAQGLFDNLNNQMLEDRRGCVWIGCNRGIYRVGTDSLHAVADRRQASLECLVYGTSDGMVSAETNGETDPAGGRDADGALWFPTTVGIVRLDPERVRGNDIPPLPVVDEVLADHVRLDWRGVGDTSPQLRLGPGRGRVLEIRYTAGSLSAPERVRFKHRLLGHDAAWVDAGSRRLAFYTNLRPGAYRFEVLAANEHGLWADVPAAFSFHLAPHFYQTRWFPAVVLAAVAGLLWWAHRTRLAFLRRRLALESELSLALERERIARDMHDDLGASVTQIGLLGEQLRGAVPGPAVEGIRERIVQAAAAAAQAMEETVWTINPRNDQLDQLAGFLCQVTRDFLASSAITCRLDIPAQLPSRPVGSVIRQQLVLVLKEALANVVHHSGASEVRVQLQVDGDRLTLTVSDNGRGLDPSGAGRRAGRGNGLVNMRERIAALGGEFSFASTATGGTSVQAVIPLPAVSPRPPAATG